MQKGRAQQHLTVIPDPAGVGEALGNQILVGTSASVVVGSPLDHGCELHVANEEVSSRAMVLVGLGAHGAAKRFLESDAGMASEHGLNGGRGHLPVAYAHDIETGPSLHEVSFDPAFGRNFRVE